MDKELPELGALTEEAGRFTEGLIPKSTGATLITLSGELGAGKTSFTQGVAKALGVEDTVTSPTFVLEKVYDLTAGPFARLVHIDAYRLENGKGLAALGFDELMKDAGNLVLLEWPERITDALPKADIAITLAVTGFGRSISYEHA